MEIRLHRGPHCGQPNPQAKMHAAVPFLRFPLSFVASGELVDVRRQRPIPHFWYAQIDARYVEWVYDPKTIVAVDEGNGEAGGDALDEGDLPVAEEGIRERIPTAAEGLATAEGQVVEDAAGEAVVQVDL